MKAKLLSILSNCIYNKSLADFKAIDKLISSINEDNITDINIKFNDTSVYISMFNSDYQLISVSFTDTNKVLFNLPDNIIKTHVIKNCGYNMKYSDIKALLSK